MNKIIMELEKTFEKKYLKDCKAYEALRVKSLIIELICIEEGIKIRKNLTIENHM